jgi:hypothetical protein
MSWNYRIIRRKFVSDIVPDGEYSHGIHEVYYDEAKQPYTWSTNPIAPRGETLEDIKGDINLMQKAFNLPVLEETKRGEGEDATETLSPI